MLRLSGRDNASLAREGLACYGQLLDHSLLAIMDGYMPYRESNSEKIVTQPIV